MDRDIYKSNILKELENCKNLSIKEGSVEDLIIDNKECKGIILQSGELISSDTTVITTGTFLGGVCHIGN